MKIKQDFPILKRKLNGKQLVYLDSSSTSQKPNAVISAISNFYSKYNANINRGIYTLSEEATTFFNEAREKVANFISAEENEIVFTKSCTEALNLLGYSLTSELKKGDEILLSVMEHHSNFVIWQQIAKQKRLKLKFVDVTFNGKLDLKDLEKKLSTKTKIVSLTHISNVLGVINPVEKITKLIKRKSKAIIIVDGAQALGHISVDVKKLGIDFYVFSGHKMYGPTGIGCLYGKKELLREINPFLYGGDMIEEVTFFNSSFRNSPQKFEAGTQAISEAIALGVAIDYLESIGMEKIKKYEEELKDYLIKNLIEMDINVLGNPEVGIVSFNLDNIHPHDVATILDSEAIAIRAGHHCCMPLMNHLNLGGTCRVSFGIYNTKEDVDKLIRALKKVRRVFRK